MNRLGFKPLCAALAFAWAGVALAGTGAGFSLASPVHSPERLRSRTAEQIGAPAAHGLNAMGKGVTIGVADTGVNARHQELAGRVSIPLAWNATTNSAGGLTDANGHGTFVASIIAASMDGKGIYGVAPQARVLPVQIFPGSSGSTSEAMFTAGLQYTIGRAPIVNLSLGASIELGKTAVQESVRAGQLLVIAAGNSGLPNPAWPARYAKESWANGRIIAVGAVDSNNRIANFSNKAGDARDYYLVAPGVSVIGASGRVDNGYVTMSGTSMAAPAVAGAAGVIKGYWNYLSAAQIATVLFKTATHLGTSPAAQPDPIYGWGLANLEKALQPIGVPGIAMRNGRVVPVTASVFVTGPALAGALRAAAVSGALKVSALDDIGRDFTYDLGASIANPRPLTAEQLFGRPDRRMLSADRILGPLDGRMAIAIEGPGLQFGSMHAYEMRAHAPSALAGFALTQRPAGDIEIAFGTMGMQNFFGVEGMEVPAIRAANAPASANGYLALVPGATTIGYGRLLANGWKVKIGLMSSRFFDPGQSQYGANAQNTGASLGIVEVSRSFGTAVVGVSLANLDEPNAILGMSGQQAFAVADGPQTTVTTLSAAWSLAPAEAMTASYSLGHTRSFSNSADSLVKSGTDASSDAFGVGLVTSDAWRTGDRLSLSLFQPLRATSGSLELDVASGVSDAGALTREIRTLPLSSPARELTTEAGYTMPLTKQSSAGFMLVSRRNPGAVPGRTENVVALRYLGRF